MTWVRRRPLPPTPPTVSDVVESEVLERFQWWTLAELAEPEILVD